MLFSGAINGFPVYRKSKAGIMAKEILQLCVDGDLPDKNVCKRVPVGVTENFIVDLEAVHHKDLTVDDNGFYGAHPAQPSTFRFSLMVEERSVPCPEFPSLTQRARVLSLPLMTTLLSEDSTDGQEVTRTVVK